MKDPVSFLHALVILQARYHRKRGAHQRLNILQANSSNTRLSNHSRMFKVRPGDHSFGALSDALRVTFTDLGVNYAVGPVLIQLESHHQMQTPRGTSCLTLGVSVSRSEIEEAVGASGATSTSGQIRWRPELGPKGRGQTIF
jgi:hypothetical protein